MYRTRYVSKRDYWTSEKRVFFFLWKPLDIMPKYFHSQYAAEKYIKEHIESLERENSCKKSHAPTYYDSTGKKVSK